MMVSSAKQKKSERVLLNLRPYTLAMQRILRPLLDKEEEVQTASSPFMTPRPLKRVAIAAFSSNSGLVGRFNHTVAERVMETISHYQQLGTENILLYPVGEKIAKAAQSKGATVRDDFLENAEKPTYANSRHIAHTLMDLYISGAVDRVELIYHHYQGTRSQVLRQESFLPIDFSQMEKEISTSGATHSAHSANEIDYLLEPDRDNLLELMIPKVLLLKLYTTHVDSVTSEHAARVTAMQIATDNADELVEELRLEYNKMRQQSITNELLDIMGGTIGR